MSSNGDDVHGLCIDTMIKYTLVYVNQLGRCIRIQ